MEVKIAENAGFCKGVSRAFEKALIQNYGTKILGQLVHNPDVSDILEERGILQINSTDDVQQGDTVIIRAHGATTPILHKLREEKAEIVDCTCRKVRGIQRLAQDHSKKGEQVVVFGEKGHPEFESLCSFAGNDVIRISSLEEIVQINKETQRLVLLAQTTSSPGRYQEVKESLQAQIHELIAPNTLCDYTQKARASAVALGRNVDMMLVIGGSNSSNTNNLALACIEEGTRTHRIENADGLKGIDLTNIDEVGIAAGASTLPSTIQEVADSLKDI